MNAAKFRTVKFEGIEKKAAAMPTTTRATASAKKATTA